jgi:hypothetical protein
VKEKNNYYVTACFFENSFTKSKDCSESRIRIFVPAFLCCHWPIFSASEQFSESHAAFGTTFRVTESTT